MNPAELRAELTSADPEQRRQAVANLVNLRGPQAVALLMLALADDDWRVRKEAARVAPELSPPGEVVEALASALGKSDDVGLCNASIEALACFGQLAVDQLALSVASLSADGRKMVAETLGRSRQLSAFPVLRGLARDADCNVRVAAIEAMESVGAGCIEDVVPILRGILAEGSDLEKLAALDAANRLGIVLGYECLAGLMDDPILMPSAMMAASRVPDTVVAPLLVERLVACTPNPPAWLLLALGEYLRADPVRFEAGRAAISRLGHPGVAEAVLALRSEDMELERARVVVLAAIGDEASVRALLGMAEQDELLSTVDAAVRLLGTVATPVLFSLAEQGSEVERLLALRQLGRLVDVVDTIRLRDTVLAVLENSSTEAVVVSLEILQRTSDEVCFERLLLVLPRLGKAQRRLAWSAIVTMARRHPSVAKAFVSDRSIQVGMVDVAVLVLGALAMAGVEIGEQESQLLVSALSNDDPDVRCDALDALARFERVSALDAVIFALTDEEKEVRLSAVRALGRLSAAGKSAHGVQRIVELVHQTDDMELMVAAVHALATSGDAQALPVLRPVARGANPAAAVAAVEAIGQVTDPRRVDALIDSLSHTDPEVVKAALYTLANERDLRASTHLLACLDHEAWDVRRLAADLLGRIGGEVATSLLRAKMATEAESLVREAIFRALGEIESPGLVRSSTPVPGLGSWRQR